MVMIPVLNICNVSIAVVSVYLDPAVVPLVSKRWQFKKYVSEKLGYFDAHLTRKNNFGSPVSPIL